MPKVCQNYGDIKTLIFKGEYDSLDPNFLSPSWKNVDLAKTLPRK